MRAFLITPANPVVDGGARSGPSVRTVRQMVARALACVSPSWAAMATVEGGGVQQLQDGRVFRYPPEGFTGIGSINGHRVRCLTAAVQLLCHTGYVPDENDIHDVHLIHTHFGLPLPPGYEP
jgi:hypothetical protein